MLPTVGLTSGPSEQELVFKSRQPRRIRACRYCSEKKIRCNFGNRDSCANCLDKSLDCTTPRSSRLRRKNRLHEHKDSNVTERVTRMEDKLQQLLPSYRDSVTGFLTRARLLSHPNAALSGPVDENGVTQSTDDSPGANVNQETLALAQQQSRHDHDAGDGELEIEAARISAFPLPQLEIQRQSRYMSRDAPPDMFPGETDTESTLPACNWGSPASLRNSASIHDAPSSQDSPEEFIDRTSIASNELSNWEWHGPRTFMSICSRAGIQWVAKKTSSPSFAEAAKVFIVDTTRRLKIQRRISPERMPEPDLETAWAYTRAYFEDAIDAGLAIVHRPWFEAQLTAFYNSGKKNNDAAWYALRNAIFASGCRIELSKFRSFQDANETAWRYFENTLSVYTEIILFRTSVLGVQALVIMAYYSSNISSYCLEYMLCNSALRLAVAQGLHRRAVSSWNFSQHEINQRQCVFWAVYCLEKQIVCQSGRHSMVDDDDINLPLPAIASHGSTLNLPFCNALIKLARLQSLASKRLSNVRALRQGHKYLIKAVTELDEQLIMLKQTIDPILSLNTQPDLGRVPEGMTLKQTMYLRYAIFNITLFIHTALTNPWSRNMPGQSPRSELHPQLEKSSHMVAETCRTAIQSIGHVRFDASTPVSLSIFGPLHALVNLFICILQSPKHPNVQSDLSLLDVGAGYFAWVRYATSSEVCIHFAKELANLARTASLNHQSIQQDTATVSEDGSALLPFTQLTQSADDSCVRLPYALQMNTHVAPPSDQSFHFEFDDWSILLPNTFDTDLIHVPTE